MGSLLPCTGDISDFMHVDMSILEDFLSVLKEAVTVDEYCDVLRMEACRDSSCWHLEKHLHAPNVIMFGIVEWNVNVNTQISM